MYILEVLKYIKGNVVDEHGTPVAAVHIGYMSKLFKTKKDADSYYKLHNPHMRSIIHNPQLSSDWDPKTELLYIIRRFTGREYLNVPSFDGKFEVEYVDHMTREERKVLRVETNIHYINPYGE